MCALVMSPPGGHPRKKQEVFASREKYPLQPICPEAKGTLSSGGPGPSLEDPASQTGQRREGASPQSPLPPSRPQEVWVSALLPAGGVDGNAGPFSPADSLGLGPPISEGGPGSV